MFCEELLTKDFPVLKIDNSGSQALALMEELKVKHLPVVKEGKYLFLLSEKEVFDMPDPQDCIDGISYNAPCVKKTAFVMDILHIMSIYKVTILPVVDDTGTFAGVITQSALIEELNEICNTGSHGALIGVELNPQDYLLSQLVHLVESNNAQIINLFTHFDPETEKLLILLRIDLEDATPVLRSLERFNYTVRFYSQRYGLTDEMMKNRLDELMYYLEM